MYGYCKNMHAHKVPVETLVIVHMCYDHPLEWVILLASKDWV